MEIWKDIKGYEGKYQISSFGRVKSLPRKTNNRNGSYTTKERILKAGLSGCGYLTTALSKDGKCKTFKIHQLVAIVFLNHNPCGHNLVIDHLDNNPKNNRVDNLEIVTARENANRRKVKRTSTYSGVCWDKDRKRWRGCIYLNGKTKYLGLFTSEIEAAKAYQNALNNIIKL